MKWCNKKNIKFAGVIIILIGVLFNPILVQKLLSYSHNLERSSVIAVYIIEFSIVAFGISIIIFRGFIFKNRREITLFLTTFVITGVLICYMILKFYPFGWENGFGLDPIRHHKVVPNTNYKLQFPDYNNIVNLYTKNSSRIVKFRTNSYGFVDGEIDVKDKTKVRIVLLGDSQTEASYIKDNFANLLEKKLNQIAGDERYEVINTALGSYSPIIEYNILKHIALDFEPRIIMLGFDMTDVADDFKYHKNIKIQDNKDYLFDVNTPWLFKYEKNYNSLKMLFSIFKSFGNSINRYFEKLDTNISKDIQNRLLIKKRNSGIIELDPIYAYSYKNEAEFKKHLNLSLYYIKRIAMLSNENNITFVLYAIPQTPQIFNDYDCLRNSLGLEKNTLYSKLIFYEFKKFSDENNVIFLLPIDVLKNSKIKPYFPCDIHLNEHGHKIMADFLYSNLEPMLN